MGDRGPGLGGEPLAPVPSPLPHASAEEDARGLSRTPGVPAAYTQLSEESGWPGKSEARKTRAPAVRDFLRSLSHCLVPNHMVCSFSMSQGGDSLGKRFQIKHMVSRVEVSTLGVGMGTHGPFPGLCGLFLSPQGPEPGICRSCCRKGGAESRGSEAPIQGTWGLWSQFRPIYPERRQLTCPRGGPLGSLLVRHFVEALWGPARVPWASCHVGICGVQHGGSPWVWHLRAGRDALPFSQQGFISKLLSGDPLTWP